MPASEALQGARDTYQSIHFALVEAREKCTQPDDRCRLRDLAEAVQEILTAVDRADMQSRTVEFEALNQKIGAANSDLEKLKSEIEAVVHDVECPQKVVSAINAGLAASAKLFG